MYPLAHYSAIIIVTSMIADGVLAFAGVGWRGPSPKSSSRLNYVNDNLPVSQASSPLIQHPLKPLIQHRETFDRESWMQGFSTVEQEDCFDLPGSFPFDLCGTYFQNGHAKFEAGDERVVHPFDGDGMLTAVTFYQGKAWFRNRFVEVSCVELSWCKQRELSHSSVL